MTAPLLEVRDLRTHFYTRRGVVKAVNGVNFSLRQGATLGLVGESGSGKSVTALSILRLLPRGSARIVEGNIIFNGEDLLQKSEREMQQLRGRQISMMFQDAMTSLNPVFTIGNQVIETIRFHQGRKGAEQKAEDILGLVRIPAPKVRMSQYPHQMSGGMRQRVVGAIALSCEPKLLIADEPTTALDVTIGAQYLYLLKDLQQSIGFAMLFITHDFRIVANLCDNVAVMYAGRIVENAGVNELFNHPRHPYTVGLTSCLPELEDEGSQLPSIPGQPPSLIDLPVGCAFALRCSHVQDRCRLEDPPQVVVGPDHYVKCWLESGVGRGQ